MWLQNGLSWKPEGGGRKVNSRELERGKSCAIACCMQSDWEARPAKPRNPAKFLGLSMSAVHRRVLAVFAFDGIVWDTEKSRQSPPASHQYGLESKLSIP